MDRFLVAPQYNDKFLEQDRPQPLMDNYIDTLVENVIKGTIDKDVTDQVYKNFIEKTTDHITKSNFNFLTGFDRFIRTDIINGCTQFIDNLYMQGPVQILEGDYKYHWRLGQAHIAKCSNNLRSDIPLILATPFPSTGKVYTDIQKLLDDCIDKNIDVHIDGAWISCSRNIEFNFDHPVIKSFAISLSKGLGLGWCRLGVRWHRENIIDSITLMNDYKMNNRISAIVGNYFLDNLKSDYLWRTHEHRYNKICKDFNLEKTNSIHLAKKQGRPVGVSPLIRYLENHGI